MQYRGTFNMFGVYYGKELQAIFPNQYDAANYMAGQIADYGMDPPVDEVVLWQVRPVHVELNS